MRSSEAGNQRYARTQYAGSPRYDSLNPEAWATEQERKLAEKIRRVLKKNLIHGEEELRQTMAALKTLGVKSTQHFSFIETEELTGKGIPLVTARILKREFGTSRNRSPFLRFMDQANEFLETPLGRFLSSLAGIGLALIAAKYVPGLSRLL